MRSVRLAPSDADVVSRTSRRAGAFSFAVARAGRRRAAAAGATQPNSLQRYAAGSRPSDWVATGLGGGASARGAFGTAALPAAPPRRRLRRRAGGGGVHAGSSGRPPRRSPRAASSTTVRRARCATSDAELRAPPRRLAAGAAPVRAAMETTTTTTRQRRRGCRRRSDGRRRRGRRCRRERVSAALGVARRAGGEQLGDSVEGLGRRAVRRVRRRPLRRVRRPAARVAAPTGAARDRVAPVAQSSSSIASQFCQRASERTRLRREVRRGTRARRHRAPCPCVRLLAAGTCIPRAARRRGVRRREPAELLATRAALPMEAKNVFVCRLDVRKLRRRVLHRPFRHEPGRAAHEEGHACCRVAIGANVERPPTLKPTSGGSPPPTRRVDALATRRSRASASIFRAPRSPWRCSRDISTLESLPYTKATRRLYRPAPCVRTSRARRVLHRRAWASRAAFHASPSGVLQREESFRPCLGLLKLYLPPEPRRSYRRASGAPAAPAARWIAASRRRALSNRSTSRACWRRVVRRTACLDRLLHPPQLGVALPLPRRRRLRRAVGVGARRASAAASAARCAAARWRGPSSTARRVAERAAAPHPVAPRRRLRRGRRRRRRAARLGMLERRGVSALDRHCLLRRSARSSAAAVAARRRRPRRLALALRRRRLPLHPRALDRRARDIRLRRRHLALLLLAEFLGNHEGLARGRTPTAATPRAGRRRRARSPPPRPPPPPEAAATARRCSSAHSDAVVAPTAPPPPPPCCSSSFRANSRVGAPPRRRRARPPPPSARPRPSRGTRARAHDRLLELGALVRRRAQRVPPPPPRALGLGAPRLRRGARRARGRRRARARPSRRAALATPRAASVADAAASPRRPRRRTPRRGRLRALGLERRLELVDALHRVLRLRLRALLVAPRLLERLEVRRLHLEQDALASLDARRAPALPPSPPPPAPPHAARPSASRRTEGVTLYRAVDPQREVAEVHALVHLRNARRGRHARRARARAADRVFLGSRGRFSVTTGGGQGRGRDGAAAARVAHALGSSPPARCSATTTEGLAEEPTATPRPTHRP